MMYGLEAVTVRPGLLVIKSARAQLTLLALLWRPDALPRDAERWYGLKNLAKLCLMSNCQKRRQGGARGGGCPPNVEKDGPRNSSEFDEKNWGGG